MTVIEKIKKGLKEMPIVHFHKGDPEPRITPLNFHDLECLHADAIALIEQLEPFKVLVEQYIENHRITCSEDIWQRDDPRVDAIVLADELCKLVLEERH